MLPDAFAFLADAVLLPLVGLISGLLALGVLHLGPMSGFPQLAVAAACSSHSRLARNSSWVPRSARRAAM
eukprot:16427508-Heterocapsa_arctica.AAC.1